MRSKKEGTQKRGKPAQRKRKTIALPLELARTLSTYAAWNGRSEQDVVAEALAPVLAGFYCATRSPGDPTGQPAGAGSAAV